MTTLGVVNAFQTLHSAVSGVTTAPAVTSTPNSFTADKLPCVLTIPGPAIVPPGAGGLGSLRLRQRTYFVRCYVAPDSAPDFGVVFADAVALLDGLEAVYRANRTIGGATVMYSAGTGVEDLGFLRTMGFGGAQFYGFEIRVPVTETA